MRRKDDGVRTQNRSARVEGDRGASIPAAVPPFGECGEECAVEHKRRVGDVLNEKRRVRILQCAANMAVVRAAAREATGARMEAKGAHVCAGRSVVSTPSESEVPARALLKPLVK